MGMDEKDDQLTQVWRDRWDTFAITRETLAAQDETLYSTTMRSSEVARTAATSRIEDYSQQRDIQVKNVLGEGGMGVVWLAEQTTIGREVAVKTIRDTNTSMTANQELLREAWITGRLEHPNIIPVHSIGIDEHQRPLFVMKRVEGVSWADAIDEPERLPDCYEGEDDLAVHLEIFEQVCRATHFANSRHILHRDIKPDNVMLGSFGEIYLVDLGIAIALDDNEHAIPSVRDISSPAGTPAFMAPEMAGVKTEDFGPWTDVYVLGATLHFVLTRESRHFGKDLFSTMFAAFRSAPFVYGEDVPDALAEICNRATHKEISERYQNAEELRRAVAEFRRHRASIRVSKKALSSLERFEALASEIETFGEEHLIRAYRLYGECRFGFEQALEIWPDNKDSLDGLERTVRTMILLEIEQHNVVAARSLLQEIEDDQGMLSQRLEALEQEIEAERKRIEALEAADRERDPRADRRQRGIAMVMLALSLALINVVQVVLTQAGVVTMDDWDIFRFKLVDLAISMVILTAIVVKVNLNDFGKNVIHALGFLLTAGVAIRFGGLIQGMKTEETVIFESIFYAFFTMGVGLFSDRRLVRLGPLCLLSGVGSYFMPEYSWPIRVAVNLILLGCIGALWTLHGGDAVEGMNDARR